MTVRDMRLGMVIGAKADGTVRRELGRVGREVETLQARMRKVQLARTAGSRVVKLRKQLETLRRASGQSADAAKKHQSAIAALEKELKEASAEAKRLGVNLDKPGDSLRELAAEAKTAEAQLARLARRQGAVGKQLDDLAEKRRLGAVDAGRRRVATTGAADRRGVIRAAQRQIELVNAQRKALLKLQRAQRKAGGSNKQLADRIKDTERALRDAEAAAENYGVDTRKIVREQARLGRSMERAERQVKRLEAARDRAARAERRRRNLQRGGRVASVAAGAAFGTAAVVGGRGALSFDDAMTRLRSQLSGLSPGEQEAEMRKSAEQAIAVALDKGLNANDILTIQYEIGSGDIDRDTARAAAPLVAQVARVTQGNAGDVASVMTRLVREMGDQLEGTQEEQFQQVADLLVRAQDKFQLSNFSALGESMRESATLLATRDIDLTQAVTLAGLMNNFGMESSRAGTALTAMARQLPDASQEFGFEIKYDARGGLDVLATLEALDQAIGGFDNLTEESRAQLQDAFGDEGLRGAALLLKNLEQSKAAVEDMAATNKGSTAAKDAIWQGADGQKIRRLGRNIGLLSQTIWQAWMPALGAAADKVADVVASVTKWMQENPGWTQALTGVGTALGAVNSAFAILALRQSKWMKAASLMVLGPVHGMIRGLNGLRKAMMATAATEWLGKPMSKARWMTYLGKAGWVGAAGAVGYGIGTLISKAIEGTRIGDAIGAGIARLLAFFGVDEAQESVARMDAAEAEQDTGTVASATPPGGRRQARRKAGRVPDPGATVQASATYTRRQRQRPAAAKATGTTDAAPQPLSALPEVAALQAQPVPATTNQTVNVTVPNVTVQATPDTDREQIARDMSPAIGDAVAEALDRWNLDQQRARRTTNHG